MVKNRRVFDVFRRWSLKTRFLTMKKCSVFEVSGGLVVFLKFLQIIFRGVPKERQRSILGGFGGPLRALWGVLFGILEGLWLFLGIFWGPKLSEPDRVHIGLLSQVESPGGPRGSPGADFRSSFMVFLGTILVCVW